MYPVSRAQTAAYDRVATMFSPDGRLYQVEYASKIVEQGTLGIGIIYDKGVLFAADKKAASSLILPASIEKVFVIDNHIGAISAGLVGDARRLVQIAREEAQENQMYYDQPIEIETLVKRISGIMQVFTQYGGMRPFGVSFVIGGIDSNNEKRLFETEPSGALAEYRAIAIGRNRKEAMKLLEKDYREEINFKDAIMLSFEATKKALPENEKADIERMEYAFIEEGKAFKRITKEELKTILSKPKQ